MQDLIYLFNEFKVILVNSEDDLKEKYTLFIETITKEHCL